MSLWIAKEYNDVWLMNEKPSFDGLKQINQTKISHASSAAMTLLPKRLVAAAGIDLKPGESIEVQLVRVAEPVPRTPSTGLPPVCDGAAAMKIDPPGSVAAPHQIRHTGPNCPTCKTNEHVVGGDPWWLCCGCSREWHKGGDHPIPAIRLARIVMSVAEQAAMGDGMSLADALSMLARNIAHPLRLGEHG